MRWPVADRYTVAVETRGSFDQVRIAPAESRPPGPGQVEVRTRASGLNFRDVLNVLGLYPEAPPLGGECAGIVSRVGDGVTHVVPGQEVVGIAVGSLSSHVLVDAPFVAPAPARLTAEQAVTIPVVYVTASFALEHLARVRPGQRVLVHAAAGGVGLAAVHLAQQAGAEVFATASSPRKHALLRSIGVEHVMNSRSAAFSGEILAATGGRGVDVVLNSLSGPLIEASFAALASGGTFLEIGKNAIWSADRVRALDRNLTYHVIDWTATAREDPSLVAGLFRRILARVGEGTLPPLPHRTLDIGEVADGFRLMAQGRHLGKLVIRHPMDERDLLRADGTYLVTGGLSGLGLRTAEWLAAHGARALVLIGRRPPAADAVHAIDQLCAKGVAVRVANVDVVDRAALSALLEQVRRAGPPIRGLVHAAGTLADGILLNQSWEQFAEVFAAKVFGLTALSELTSGDPLEFCTFFSSTAGVFGSPGQANHAAASTFEDALAASRRARGLAGTSIAWGAWSTVGAGARHAVGDRREATGVAWMAPELALDAFGRLLRGPAAQPIVSAIDREMFREAITVARRHVVRPLGRGPRAPAAPRR